MIEEGIINIKFNGEDYLLIGDIEGGGAIATKEQYENFELSYAHLFPDGIIMRFEVQIGTINDLEFIK